VQPPPDDPAAKTRQEQREDRSVRASEHMVTLTKFLIVATVMTLMFVGWQAWETRKAAAATVKNAGSAEQQTALLRQQLIGTLGAVVHCTIRQSDVGVAVGLSNVGQVDARDVHGSVRIAPVELPDLTPLTASPAVHLFSYAVVAHQRQSSARYAFPSEWLPPRDWTLWRSAHTVMVEVEFLWDNGFGDKMQGRQSGVYLPQWEYRSSGGSRSEDAQFHDESGIADRWRDISAQLANGYSSQDPEHQNRTAQPNG
jgi:hypothetical protein